MNVDIDSVLKAHNYIQEISNCKEGSVENQRKLLEEIIKILDSSDSNNIEYFFSVNPFDFLFKNLRNQDISTECIKILYFGIRTTTFRSFKKISLVQYFEILDLLMKDSEYKSQLLCIIIAIIPHTVNIAFSKELMESYTYSCSLLFDVYDPVPKFVFCVLRCHGNQLSTSTLTFLETFLLKFMAPSDQNFLNIQYCYKIALFIILGGNFFSSIRLFTDLSDSYLIDSQRQDQENRSVQNLQVAILNFLKETYPHYSSSEEQAKMLSHLILNFLIIGNDKISKAALDILSKIKNQEFWLNISDKVEYENCMSSFHGDSKDKRISGFLLLKCCQITGLYTKAAIENIFEIISFRELFVHILLHLNIIHEKLSISPIEDYSIDDFMEQLRNNIDDITQNFDNLHDEISQECKIAYQRLNQALTEYEIIYL